MRLDYALYGLSIILFAITAITIAMVAEQDGRTVYAISTSIVGVLSIVGGYFLRPGKAAKVIESAIPAPETIEPATVAKTAEVKVQNLEASKTEQQNAEVPQVKVARNGDNQVLKDAPCAAENSDSTRKDAPVTVSTADVALPAPPVQAAISAPPSPPALGSSVSSQLASKMEFAQIRGISEKRAEQLRAIGINTVQELANASAADLAVKLDVSPRIVKMWIGTAKKLVK